MEWPTEPVDLAEAARLFTLAGRPINRSNLSRYVASRTFPHQLAGRRKLVEARALFDAWSHDLTRETMAGSPNLGAQAPGAAPTAEPSELRAGDAGGRTDTLGPPSAGDPNTPPRYDAKRRELDLKVQERELDIAKRLREVVPVEEVAAAMATSIAELRAALAVAVQDQADMLLHELGLPATRIGILRTGLKRFARLGQTKFAEAQAKLLREGAEPDSAARARLDELVEVALQLRAEATEDVKV